MSPLLKMAFIRPTVLVGVILLNLSGGLYAQSWNCSSSICSVGTSYTLTANANNGAGPRFQIGNTTTPNLFAEFGAYSSQNNFDSKDRDLQFFGNSTVGIMLKANGNVGIGITNPNSALHVHGSDWNGITLSSSSNTNKWGTLKYNPVGNMLPGKSFLILSDETPNTDGTNGGIVFRTNNGPTGGYTIPAVAIRETGSVGIGTLSPGATLDVNGTAHFSGNVAFGGAVSLQGGVGQNGPLFNVIDSSSNSVFSVSQNSYSSLYAASQTGGLHIGSAASYGYLQPSYDGGGSTLRISGNWNAEGEVTPFYAEFRRNVVAIANSYAQYHLDVGGNRGDDGVAALGTFRVFDQTTGGATNAVIQAGAGQGATDILDVLANNGGSLMNINGAGRIGIGTASPCTTAAPSGCLMSVNGAIQAKEVVVNTGWPDYVFDPDYELKPLSDVAGFLKQNHHLPGIPSASEVQEKGVSLGDMQAKLLAQIEELTLHMIEAEKDRKALRQENQQLRTDLNKLTRQMPSHKRQE